MELEFRKKEGTFMFGLKGEIAENAFNLLLKTPELVLTESELKTDSNNEFKKFKVFECIKRFGYVLFKSVEIIMNEGDYIKIK
jgi:hypothetical protein